MAVSQEVQAQVQKASLGCVHLKGPSQWFIVSRFFHLLILSSFFSFLSAAGLILCLSAPLFHQSVHLCFL